MAVKVFYFIVIICWNLTKYCTIPKISTFDAKTIRGHKTRCIVSNYWRATLTFPF